MIPVAPAKTKNLRSPTDLYAFLGLLVSLIIFYPEIFLAKSASLAGDHWEQHYPWAVLMATSLKQGVIPWWTSMIQSGFPIAAEGQIGVFYLPNLLLYTLLPVKWGYSYQNAVHFLISGWGTYLYCRQMKLSPFPAWIAAFAFLFGTSYGGAYYNLTSLKTICWFPWILYCSERFLETDRKRYLLAISVCLALSQLAGYLQMAAFAMVIMFLYLVLRTIFFHERASFSFPTVLKYAAIFGATFVFGIVLAAPQIWMTFKLAVGSSRINLTEDYAYVGSLFPGALLTVVYPMMQQVFRGACLYVGTLPVLLMCVALVSRASRQTTMFKLWLMLSILALLLALGEWSPLYIAIVKLTHFYSFRIPAKFLGFVCFGIAMLAGVGMQALLDPTKSVDEGEFKKGSRLYIMVTGVCLTILVGAYFLLTVFGTSGLQTLGEKFVTNYIYGRSGHPHELQAYIDRLGPYFEACMRVLRPWGSFWNVWCYSMVGLGMVLAYFMTRMKRSVWVVLAAVFLFVDLFVFSWNDIKKDFGNYAEYEKKSVTVTKLLEEKKSPGFGRLYGMRGMYDALPLTPSTNILYGIEDIGGYSPLISHRYLETIGQLGNVNDSNSAQSPQVDFVLDRLPLLDFLNVTHILAAHSLKHPDLELIAQDSSEGSFLYRNLGRPAPAYFISRERVFSGWEELKAEFLKPGFDPKQVVFWEGESPTSSQVKSAEGDAGFEIRLLQQTAHQLVWQVTTRRPGTFVLSSTFDAGWSATLNGMPTAVLKAFGLFQAVEITTPGSYKIIFKYSPWK